MKLSYSIIIFLIISSCSINSQNSVSDRSKRHYVVVDVEVSSIEKYDEFIKLEIPILKKFDAYIEMDIRNPDQRKRIIIISFPNHKIVKLFVKSEEFQKILPMNKSSANSKIFHGKLY